MKRFFGILGIGIVLLLWLSSYSMAEDTITEAIGIIQTYGTMYDRGLLSYTVPTPTENLNGTIQGDKLTILTYVKRPDGNFLKAEGFTYEFKSQAYWSLSIDFTIKIQDKYKTVEKEITRSKALNIAAVWVKNIKAAMSNDQAELDKLMKEIQTFVQTNKENEGIRYWPKGIIIWEKGIFDPGLSEKTVMLFRYCYLISDSFKKAEKIFPDHKFQDHPTIVFGQATLYYYGKQSRIRYHYDQVTKKVHVIDEYFEETTPRSGYYKWTKSKNELYSSKDAIGPAWRWLKDAKQYQKIGKSYYELKEEASKTVKWEEID